MRQTWPPRAPKRHYSARFGPDIPAKSPLGALLKPLFRQFQGEVRRISLPRTPVNKGKRTGRGSQPGWLSGRKRKLFAESDEARGHQREILKTHRCVNLL